LLVVDEPLNSAAGIDDDAVWARKIWTLLFFGMRGQIAPQETVGLGHE
jgi:hypothetical protein